MIKIRPMRDEDFEIINSWYSERMMPIPPKDIYPPTSYMAEHDGVPVVCASLFLMNCQGAAMIENLVGNPNMSTARREVVPMMFRHIEEMAKNWGYNKIVLFAHEERLKNHYEGFGYTKTLENVTTYSKKL